MTGDRTRDGFLLLVLATGMLLTFALVLQIPDGVFFSCDGGVKYRMALQYERGELKPFLELKKEGWAAVGREHGYSPLAPPFFWELDGRSYPAFPPAFPLLSTPGYRQAGFRGLLVLPLLSIWLLWLVFIQTCRVLDLGPTAVVTATTALVFASPLSLYGAMFWEHAPAVLLTFLGFWYAACRRPGRGLAMFTGVAVGTAVWMRPECIFVAVFLCGFALHRARQRRGAHGLAFIGAAAAPILLFFCCNALVYGHPLGIHFRQISGGVSQFGQVFSLSPGQRLTGALTGAGRMTVLLLVYFPLVLCPLVTVLAKPLPDPRWRRMAMLVSGFVPFLIAGVSLILPVDNIGGKQIGPRYLLCLIPPVCLLFGILMDRFRERGPRWVVIVLLLPLLWGGWKGPVEGAGKLILNYTQRVYPALAYLREQEGAVIGVNTQHLCYELADLWESHHFFAAATATELSGLARRLKNRGIHSFYYYCHPDQPSGEQGLDPQALTVEKLDNPGAYTLYRIVIL